MSKKFFVLFLFICLVGIQRPSFCEDKTVLIAILARNKAHTLPRYLKCIESLNYNKKLISIYINTNNNTDNTLKILEEWVIANKDSYKAIIFDQHNDEKAGSTKPHEWNADRFKALATIRNKSLQQAKEQKCDYYFVADCDNFFIPSTLKDLVSKDKPIISPILRSIPEQNDLYTNYFYSCSDNGYYKDHPMHLIIHSRSLKGTFKVDLVHCAYLINTAYIDKLNYIDGTDDYEFIIFSRNARKNQVDQYICNEKEYGTQLHFYQELTLEEERDKFLTLDLAQILPCE